MFQLDEKYVPNRGVSVLDRGSEGAELCLMQLPCDWAKDTTGSLELSRTGASVATLGAEGAQGRFHVVESAFQPPSRVYAAFPGNELSVVPVQKRLVFIRAEALDVAGNVINKASQQDATVIAPSTLRIRRGKRRKETDPPCSDSCTSSGQRGKHKKPKHQQSAADDATGEEDGVRKEPDMQIESDPRPSVEDVMHQKATKSAKKKKKKKKKGLATAEEGVDS